MEGFYAFLFIFTCIFNIHPGARAIGINYGLNGDDLPTPTDVVSLLKSKSISNIRLFEPNPNVLEALQGSGISVIVGTRNEDLQALASDASAATKWVETNILPYTSLNFKCISAGNEVPAEQTQYLPAAMQNLDAALTAASQSIPVTTAVSMSVLSASDPPSKGAFGSEIMSQVTSFLVSKGGPLLLNAYTYFPRISYPENVKLEFALFEGGATVVHDDPYSYDNLFDAMVDAVHAALEKAGGSDVEIIVTETGWPTEGSADASVENAMKYNNNLIRHLAAGSGTPRKPGKSVEAYIFALFNEDLKAEGVEQHWGLFYPNMTEVYPVDF
ncbi:hypothetical protein BUALT_Bualt06G0109600 [Buddleja alternifolia]|uniref:Beta-1,3-glucanase n=1 Tax=Buddleja alternifolia TaxID=168488 RepID=A0AAV6XQI8_9LAMI|nr:hypothetical protein BUALT_Bualt06G0109600 [Buddleja alternifolia]